MKNAIFTFLFAALCGATTGASGAGFDFILGGVDYENQTGFYDSNKLFDGTDDELCWAFSASNQLQRWQDKISPSLIVRVGAPNGASSKYASIITDMFVAGWVNDGGNEINGFCWWTAGFEDEDVKAPAGYWSEFFDGIESIGAEYGLDGMGRDYLGNLIKDAVSNDYGMTLGIYSDDGAHAMTLWGFGYDDDSYWLYFSDSDDGKTQITKNGISFNDEDGMWYLSGDYRDWYVGDITVFSAGVPVPEPATCALFFGAVVLFAAVARRRA